MSTKLPPDEYQKLHQRVCKIFYSQMTSSAPAQDATKLLTNIDEKTHTKEEFLDAVERKLQRFLDPVGWITEKRQRLEQICAKIDHRKRTDPDLESRFTPVGKLGLAIIRKVVNTPTSDLLVSSDDINKVHVCMSELKGIVGDFQNNASVPTIMNGRPANGIPQNNSIPLVQTIAPKVIAPPSNQMQNSVVGGEPQMPKYPSNYHQNGTNGYVKMEQTAPTQQSIAPAMANQPPGTVLPNVIRPTVESGFEDGVFAILVIDLQSLMRKLMDKTSKLTINAFAVKLETLHNLLTSWKTKNEKYFDESYKARIDVTSQIVTNLVDQLEALPVDENALVEVMWNHSSIIRSIPILQMMVDETVQFEIQRLNAKHFDSEAFMKKRRLDIEFQRRVNDAFQIERKKIQKVSSDSTLQESFERNLQLEKALDIYNSTTENINHYYQPNLFGGMVNMG